MDFERDRPEGKAVSSSQACGAAASAAQPPVADEANCLARTVGDFCHCWANLYRCRPSEILEACRRKAWRRADREWSFRRGEWQGWREKKHKEPEQRIQITDLTRMPLSGGAEASAGARTQPKPTAYAEEQLSTLCGWQKLCKNKKKKRKRTRLRKRKKEKNNTQSWKQRERAQRGEGTRRIPRLIRIVIRAFIRMIAGKSDGSGTNNTNNTNNA